MKHRKMRHRKLEIHNTNYWLISKHFIKGNSIYYFIKGNSISRTLASVRFEDLLIKKSHLSEQRSNPLTWIIIIVPTYLINSFKKASFVCQYH